MKVLRLRLHVRGPILTQSSAVGPLGVDSPILRDIDGTPLIAGTHLTGKLRQALLELADAARQAGRAEPFASMDDILVWFGKEQPGEGQDRKIVLVSDLRAVASEPLKLLEVAREKVDTRTRVAIDPVTGAALEGALQVLETPFPAGSMVAFEGVVRILAPPEQHSRIEAALVRGLRWIPQLGGERSVGFGRLDRVEVDPAPLRQPCLAGVPTRWRISLRFLEPFCIAKPARESNLYRSEEVVPGGLVKGALAYQLVTLVGTKPGTRVEGLGDDHAYATLARHFSALRVTHLFPAQLALSGRAALGGVAGATTAAVSATRPRVAPLSLVKDQEGRLYDVALCPGPLLIDGEAPTFAVDWKDQGQVEEHFGWRHPATELRVRTAMSFERRSAESAQLFAYEMILPDAHVWIGELDLTAVPDDDERRGIVDDLERLVGDGLAGLGKTLATAQVLLEPMAERQPRRRIWTQRQHVITLQTPALLCSPEDMRSGATGLFGGYRQTFKELSGSKLKLVRFFADQRLAGGEHYAARFMAGHAYYPWVLTEAGSVFVVEPVGDGEKALEALKTWERGGLEIARRVQKAYAHMNGKQPTELWQCCPFVRENGYGEVAVDMPEHLELMPDGRCRLVDPEPVS